MQRRRTADGGRAGPAHRPARPGLCGDDVDPGSGRLLTVAELQRVLRLSMPMDAQAEHRSTGGGGGTASQVSLDDAAPRAEVAAVSRGIADARGRVRGRGCDRRRRRGCWCAAPAAGSAFDGDGGTGRCSGHRGGRHGDGRGGDPAERRVAARLARGCRCVDGRRSGCGAVGAVGGCASRCCLRRSGPRGGRWRRGHCGAVLADVGAVEHRHARDAVLAAGRCMAGADGGAVGSAGGVGGVGGRDGVAAGRVGRRCRAGGVRRRRIRGRGGALGGAAGRCGRGAGGRAAVAARLPPIPAAGGQGESAFRGRCHGAGGAPGRTPPRRANVTPGGAAPRRPATGRIRIMTGGVG